MTEICDSVITEARLLAANGEEGKETATLRVTQNDEGRGVKPDKGEIMATKSNDMDNEKCYSSTSTPILSCGEKQLVRNTLAPTYTAPSTGMSSARKATLQVY